MNEQTPTTTHDDQVELCKKYWAVRQTVSRLHEREYLTERGYTVLNSQLRDLFKAIDAVVPDEVFQELIG